ncbi:MAG: hypothetical protein FWD37_05385, partial [Methanomassiliicoccaceae archaeon]|nr:hypothetical protein [Methanomassiliicoccaceae archaeon]
MHRHDTFRRPNDVGPYMTMNTKKNGRQERVTKAVIAIFTVTLLVISSAPFLFAENEKNGNENGFDFDINEFLGASGGGSVSTIAAGIEHSVALKSDGTVWAWGLNNYGQLGDGTTTNRPNPVQVVGEGGNDFLTDVKAIAAGDYHTVALKSDGAVWAWGLNNYGQLGDGSTDDISTPVQVVGEDDDGFLTNVKAIAAGNNHTVALKNDGTVWAWGRNNSGPLGDNTVTNSHTPVQVLKGTSTSMDDYLHDVIAIAAGGQHTIALKGDGTVWALGRNTEGQLGDGTTIQRRTPVQVTDIPISAMISIAAGESHSLALLSDGT